MQLGELSPSWCRTSTRSPNGGMGWGGGCCWFGDHFIPCSECTWKWLQGGWKQCLLQWFNILLGMCLLFRQETQPPSPQKKVRSSSFPFLHSFKDKYLWGGPASVVWLDFKPTWQSSTRRPSIATKGMTNTYQYMRPKMLSWCGKLFLCLNICCFPCFFVFRCCVAKVWGFWLPRNFEISGSSRLSSRIIGEFGMVLLTMIFAHVHNNSKQTCHDTLSFVLIPISKKPLEETKKRGKQLQANNNWPLRAALAFCKAELPVFHQGRDRESLLNAKELEGRALLCSSSVGLFSIFCYIVEFGASCWSSTNLPFHFL